MMQNICVARFFMLNKKSVHSPSTIDKNQNQLAAVTLYIIHLTVNFSINPYCIPGRKSGILRIQYGHAAATAEISFGRDNLKNILVRTFKFGMWVYMGNATNAIVL